MWSEAPQLGGVPPHGNKSLLDSNHQASKQIQTLSRRVGLSPKIDAGARVCRRLPMARAGRRVPASVSRAGKSVGRGVCEQKHSFWVSPCPASPQQKLLSGP